MSATTTVETDHPHPEGIRETLESIVVALILAFVFRAFVVEAFVIPTGSMAPTLYGAHGTIVCSDCGTEFAIGLKDLADNRPIPRVESSARAICPNCSHANTNLRINDASGNAETGDRILVFKWPFDLGLSSVSAKRWDVLVFKDPSDHNADDGVTNFIKRLAGLPGEVLLIVDGDVYAAPLTKLSEEAIAELKGLRDRKFEHRQGSIGGRLTQTSQKLQTELNDVLQIARKTKVAQEALWFGVYDHDYLPKTLDGNQPRWVPMLRKRSGWNTSQRRVTFTDKGNRFDFIELQGKPILATCAYNVRERSSPPPVSDMRVRFVMTPTDRSSAVRIRLAKQNKSFWATVHSNGRVEIATAGTRAGASGDVILQRTLPPLVIGRPVQISFENVDYRVALSVGGEEVLSTSSDRESNAYYGPDLKVLRNILHSQSFPPRIYGQGGSFDIVHIAVHRDIYYYHPATVAVGARWIPIRGWASPGTPIMLRDNEYFMLGDNTSASKDARLWTEVGPHLADRGESFQLGTVPGDQLIGKAFFVYWPMGHRIDWIPILGKLGIVPDVGRMRWIR